MDTLIAQLDQKYSEYRKNLHNEHIDSDEYIFYSAYDYFCITETQPKIKEIVKNDRQDIEKKKQEIIKQNESVDIQNELIRKIESQSLSFCYGEILRDLYIPMTKYKNSSKLLSAKDIIGETELYRKRFLDILYSALKKFVQFFNITDRKDLDMHFALWKIINNFKQKKYSVYMERINNLLIPQLLKLHTQKQEIETTKTALIIDSRKGIYEKSNEKLAYSVGKNSKRFKIIKYLLTKDGCSISELADLVHQTKISHSTMRSILEINRLFRKNTGQSYDLICHNDTIGYFLNTDKFEFQLKE